MKGGTAEFRSGRGRIGFRFLAIALVPLLLPATAGAQSPETPKDWVKRIVSRVCGQPAETKQDIQDLVPDLYVWQSARQSSARGLQRLSATLFLPEGDTLTLDARLLNGETQQFRVTFAAVDGVALRPRLLAIADGSCTIRSAREIRPGEDPWVYLDQLEGDLDTLRWSETLQAPWPEGHDPGGVRVGFVDTGLAYDLPLFRDRLARDPSGEPLGYDFWDLDPWPYDGDTSRGALLPVRHGTAVASVFAAEAPEAALVPYRYPRPDMGRMADIVARAAKDKVRILAMPLGSNNAEDWQDFAEAMAGTNILAIVSAGNNGRNIDEVPVYPAALDLPNLITVTSADGFGKLAPGSNWGPASVDVMLPAENLTVTDFRGASGVASGSSYAVPRLAALAARILDAAPDLTAADLKSKLLARAAPSPFEDQQRVGAGWIPDPAAD